MERIELNDIGRKILLLLSQDILSHYFTLFNFMQKDLNNPTSMTHFAKGGLEEDVMKWLLKLVNALRS